MSKNTITLEDGLRGLEESAMAAYRSLLPYAFDRHDGSHYSAPKAPILWSDQFPSRARPVFRLDVHPDSNTHIAIGKNEPGPDYNQWRLDFSGPPPEQFSHPRLGPYAVDRVTASAEELPSGRPFMEYSLSSGGYKIFRGQASSVFAPSPASRVESWFRDWPLLLDYLGSAVAVAVELAHERQEKFATELHELTGYPQPAEYGLYHAMEIHDMGAVPVRSMASIQD